MTTETETKPVEQTEEKKEEVKEEVKKEEAETNNAEEKADDKAEKADKEKKEEEKKDVKAKKEPAAPKPAVHKLDFNKDVVYLYQFTRTPVLPSLSPYCLKVETWLRIADLKYENVDHKMKYKSKKGQLPFVEVNGEEIADSAIIIKELGTRYNKDLDASLTAEQRNVAHATISMIENHFAWVVKWWRCRCPGEWVRAAKLNLQQALNTRIPNAVLNFAFKLRYRQAAKKVRAHGIGVHKPEEIEEFGHNDLMVLSDLLGDKPFFFGDDPTTLDVVAFANLAQVAFMDKEVSYSLRDWMTENCANLVEFCNRVKERAFPDWEEMCTTLDLNSHLPKPPPTEEKAEEPATEKEEKTKEEEKKDEKEKDDTEKEKAQKDEKEGEKEDNKKTEEKEKEEEKK
ncbi:failed axon connections-like isoform X2 [Portunus trituberculatus]|uniref:failed axon connections-like isoform X2 n=1 Tax=Portunus trituberculatus TaxID=210409 RepID=UPI001E1CC658|nr:failed axon connections-like isoform X2 [Portunus trituberculatus]